MPLEVRESVFGDGVRWTRATIKRVHSCTNNTDETLPASFDAAWNNFCCAPQLFYELFPTGAPRKPRDDVLLIYLHASSHSCNNYEYHSTNVSVKITFYRGVHDVVLQLVFSKLFAFLFSQSGKFTLIVISIVNSPIDHTSGDSILNIKQSCCEPVMHVWIHTGRYYLPASCGNESNMQLLRRVETHFSHLQNLCIFYFDIICIHLHKQKRTLSPNTSHKTNPLTSPVILNALLCNKPNSTALHLYSS